MKHCIFAVICFQNIQRFNTYYFIIKNNSVNYIKVSNIKMEFLLSCETIAEEYNKNGRKYFFEQFKI